MSKHLEIGRTWICSQPDFLDMHYVCFGCHLDRTIEAIEKRAAFGLDGMDWYRTLTWPADDLRSGGLEPPAYKTEEGGVGLERMLEDRQQSPSHQHKVLHMPLELCPQVQIWHWSPLTAAHVSHLQSLDSPMARITKNVGAGIHSARFFAEAYIRNNPAQTKGTRAASKLGSLILAATVNARCMLLRFTRAIPKPYLLICTRRFTAVLGHTAKACARNIADFLSRTAGGSTREAFKHLASDRIRDKKARGDVNKVCNAARKSVFHLEINNTREYTVTAIASPRTAGRLGPNVANVHSRRGRGGRKAYCSAAPRACTPCELIPFAKGILNRF